MSSDSNYVLLSKQEIRELVNEALKAQQEAAAAAAKAAESTVPPGQELSHALISQWEARRAQVQGVQGVGLAGKLTPGRIKEKP